jgi:sodium/bile acid cotransporter 7
VFNIDKFVLFIIGVVILAYCFPQLGSPSSPIPLDTIGSVGVSLIFFFYGLKLSPEKIQAGLQNWKLHSLIQLSTFLFFPLLMLLCYPLVHNTSYQALWLSFLFLAALPSTVSSSVVMVSIAKGNLPAAIFNASISGLIGIVITPLWMGLFLQQSGGDFDLSVVYIKLIAEILLPVGLGLFLQKYLGALAVRYGKQMTSFDKTIILLIIFKSFATSFENKVFSTVGLDELLLVSVGAIAVFYVMYYLTSWLSAYLGFSLEDQITAQFCGTKKSLVHGVVFSKILFPVSFPVGMILLPLMLFHAFQIFVVSIAASKLAQRD